MNILQKIGKKILFPYAKISYSQESEDIILQELFQCLRIKQGCYVDIGAFHPQKYSNTKLLYDNGWHGINIDGNIKSIKLFNKLRIRDENIYAVISNCNQRWLKYYIYDNSALNTTDINRVKLLNLKNIHYINTKLIPNYNIADLCHNLIYHINFLNLDIEGNESDIINEFFLQNIYPDVICIENNQLHLKLFNKYNFYAKTKRNYIYVLNSFFK